MMMAPPHNRHRLRTLPVHNGIFDVLGDALETIAINLLPRESAILRSTCKSTKRMPTFPWNSQKIDLSSESFPPFIINAIKNGINARSLRFLNDLKINTGSFEIKLVLSRSFIKTELPKGLIHLRLNGVHFPAEEQVTGDGVQRVMLKMTDFDRLGSLETLCVPACGLCLDHVNGLSPALGLLDIHHNVLCENVQTSAWETEMVALKQRGCRVMFYDFLDLWM